MPKKRTNHGRNKNNRGHVKCIICSNCVTAEDDALRTKPWKDTILRISWANPIDPLYPVFILE
jgi:ribosomal protein S26